MLLLRYLCSYHSVVCLAFIALLTTTPAMAVDHHRSVFGYRSDGLGGYVTNLAGEKIVDTGYLIDDGAAVPFATPAGHADELEYYVSGENCGTAAHKPGTADWMEHWHVSRAAWPTSAAIPGKPSITQAESEAFWKAQCVTSSLDNHATKARTEGGAADFHYNCHGYALDKDGFAALKININDNAAGMGRPLAAYYSAYTPGAGAGEHRTKDTIMYLNTHTNYITDDFLAPKDHCAKFIMFKFRASQIFTYEYDDPGRNHDTNFNNTGPSYYVKD